MTVFYKENSIFKYEEIEIDKITLEDVIKENDGLTTHGLQRFRAVIYDS